MIGVDIVAISRFSDVAPSFPSKILSTRELAEYDKRDKESQREYLASRFAAKEATYKALNTRLIDYQKIEILNDSDGRPHLYIDGRETGEVSLSHDTYAIALVMINKE